METDTILRVKSIRLRRADLRTRMPFRYGIATLTELPHVFVVAEIEYNGMRQTGVAADHLPPKWFTKDPDRDPLEEIDDMLDVIGHAASLVEERTAPTVFALWQLLDAEQAAWGEEKGYPPLLYRFGVALVERAIADAFCRMQGAPFWQLLHRNAFGIDLGAVHPSLAKSQPADWLPEKPLERVFARHTVGLSDPLWEKDIADEERLHDGLPQSLESCIRTYGLRQFKIKVTAEGTTSVDRLRHVMEVIRGTVEGAFQFTLDGNESFASVEVFRAFWEAVASDSVIAETLPSLLFVEQPFHRQAALDPALGEALLSWESRPALIIDESDCEPASLRTALAMGYVGISHKNCKGLFKGVANACLLAQRRRAGEPAMMSGEDLANIGPVAVCQDLAVQAALGNASVERNGHHYFRGLSMWPLQVGEAMMAEHGDLYTTGEDGEARLHVDRGEINLRSVNAAPLGVSPLFNALP